MNANKNAHIILTDEELSDEEEIYSDAVEDEKWYHQQT